MAYWLTEANNVYNAIYKFYGGRQLPKDETGVFFGYPGCTKVVLLYTINDMRENWALGWFSDDATRRGAAIAEIAAGVWMQTNFSADLDGIIKFCNWVFVATKDNANMQRYFAGGEYGQLTNIGTALTQAVENITGGVVDVVKNIVTVPSDAAGLVQSIAPTLKWAAIIWGASKLIKAIKA